NTDGEYPLDYEHFRKSGIIYRAAATRARDGKSVFFDNKDVKQNCYDILKASCALPAACKPYPIDGELYFDGGIAEPIPIKKAFDDGCDKVILVLTKPREEYTKPIGKKRLIHAILRQYPAVAELMGTLHLRSKQILEEAESLEKEGKLVVIEPSDCFGMKTLTRDKITIYKMYRQGYEDARRLIDNSII
ncbi:MAG: patatin family protein, partial [Acutalibacteraceae bacterium]